MDREVQGNQYEAEGADKTVDELFKGNLTLEEALQQLRKRLLDLSSRNRLLNYRHPKGRSIQFVDEPNLNLVFNRLIDSGKQLEIRYVPEPDTDTYDQKRPDVKSYAEALGINVSTDFSNSSCGKTANKHSPKLQALYYPAELQKLCAKLKSEAGTIIEETGTNMLYLVFGFLELYDSDTSEKPMLAPLLAVPITLEKGSVDPETSTYKFHINYSGEDIHENQTLREKLSQDFALQLPEFEEEDDIGTYFAKIQKTIKKKKRWKVRYQLCMGFLSFGKMAIWDDLNPVKWPGLLTNPLLQQVFSGGSGKDVSLFPEDYEIDSHPQGDLPIIYDADSSQHSAIIDVLSGKNIVINGPPGTGKSQTITNIIAAGLRAGKRILFVSEKLAALEVVRHRLNRANLGLFCLELHSHKTQKKKLLGEIHDLLGAKFRQPQHLQEKISTLKRLKHDLNRYAELMAGQHSNDLGLTVFEVFWRVERRRQAISHLPQEVRSIFLKDASSWTYDDIEQRRSKLDTLGKLYETIGSFDSTHPWWGFVPRSLLPGDDESIGRILSEATAKTVSLQAVVDEIFDKAGLTSDIDTLLKLHDKLEAFPQPPASLNGDLLPRVFTPEDPLGKKNAALLAGVIEKVTKARDLNAEADSVLVSGAVLSYRQLEPIVKTCAENLSPWVFDFPLKDLGDYVESAKNAQYQFEKNLASEIEFKYLPIHLHDLTALDELLSSVSHLDLQENSVAVIRQGAEQLQTNLERLKNSFERVDAIATRRGIEFDGSPSAVKTLGQPDGIDGVLPGIQVNESILAKATEAAAHIHSDLSLEEMDRRAKAIYILHERIGQLVGQLSSHATQLGFPFDSTPVAITNMVTMGYIASSLPKELLDYRCSGLAIPRTGDLLKQAIASQAAEKDLREALANEFYLDSLPDQKDLKAAVRVFRRGDGLFNFLKKEWRTAQSLCLDLSKNKTKRKAVEYEAKLEVILRWIEEREAFLGNQKFRDAFGPLFDGFDTDFSKIQALYDWFMDSQSEILKHSGLPHEFNLVQLDAGKMMLLAAQSSHIKECAAELEKCHDAAKELLAPAMAQLESALRQSGWLDFNQKLFSIGDGLKKVVQFLRAYVKLELSPCRAIEVLNAKMELQAAHEDFAMLNNGLSIVKSAVESSLPGLVTIPCDTWGGYIMQLTHYVDLSKGLSKMLSKFAEDSVSPIRTRGFIVSKLALDDCLTKFTPLPDKTSSEWKTYSDIAKSRICQASELASTLSSVSDGTHSVKEVIVALNARQKAQDLMRDIANDTSLAAILDGIFQGVSTDLTSLAETLSWAEGVTKNRLMTSSKLSNVLLAKEVRKNFYEVQAWLSQIKRLHNEIEATLSRLSEYGEFSGMGLYDPLKTIPAKLQVEEFLNRMQIASENLDAVLPWSKYYSDRKQTKDIGLKDFVTGLENQNIPPEFIGPLFEFVAYRSIGRRIYEILPELDGFDGAKHQMKRDEFVSLDSKIINLNGQGFAYEIQKIRNVPNGVSGMRASDRTELQLIHHELGKKNRHLPIRQLIKRAGRAIQALKPCFMMGPMSVAQYLEQGAVEFDMVVMDEASQLRPEDALGAVARGKQLVVVGDPKQLPPTSFFDRLVDGGDGDEDESPAVLSGSESILDICQQLFHPVRTLRWHYRSQHQSLIDFSNHHFYGGKLVVFPSPYERNNRLGVRYRYISKGAYKDRQNVPEAQRVVDAAIEHMMHYPEESLGIVTLNQTQRDLIEDLLDKKIRNIEEAQAFVAKWEAEGWPFFVKNLENVQGDERNAIFISTTFGKAIGTDKVRQNFGPISRPDGWRRLNVLFTRARRKIELFTSMQPEDIVIDEKSPAGTKALRDYLDFAKRGVLTITDVTDREPDSDFEISVGDMLRSRGYEVVPQLGVAGFFIDLAVRNPDRSGEFLAAIECDGATYHSSNSARDRDRIRQTILESLGWHGRIWRIWSTDWFYDPRRETERLLEFLKNRRALAIQEPQFEFEMTDEDEPEVSEVQPPVELIVEPTPIISNEDLYVEVGDWVTYFLVDKPEERHTVMIVDTESNPRHNLINEKTQLALALLDLKIGDEAVVGMKSNQGHKIRVLRIQRQEEIVS